MNIYKVRIQGYQNLRVVAKTKFGAYLKTRKKMDNIFKSGQPRFKVIVKDIERIF